MKKSFFPLNILLLIISFGLSSSGCKKDETNNDEYYVKYEVKSSTIYYDGTLNVILNTENYQNKNITIDTRSPWENVIGPVKKGFEANLSVNEIESNYGHLKLYTQISVSKNGSPFAVKQSDNSDIPRTSVQIHYTINY
jgi:hypothetical protein